MFKNKKILITGGTGSFGHALLDRVKTEPFEEIRIFSRDEKKQDDMRQNYVSFNNLNFVIGDVRDYSSIKEASRGVDYIFHAAALKQVPSCEFYPMEAVKTNIFGTENVLKASISNNVKKVVCLSTDKAVYPINAMGISKSMMEKVAIANSRLSEKTNISITRYGNVMASRGSVIPRFLNQISLNEPITITDPEMTRFMMTLQDAVELVIFAFSNGEPGDIFVQKSPAATIQTLAQALLKVTNFPDHEIKIIGSRHGEKLFETLLSREEMLASNNLDGYFQVKPDNRDLKYENFFNIGEKKINTTEDYNSHNTERLSVDQMSKLLIKLDIIKKYLAGNYSQMQ